MNKGTVNIDLRRLREQLGLFGDWQLKPLRDYF
jgi:hypothetical protein